jgi:inner membrane protein
VRAHAFVLPHAASPVTRLAPHGACEAQIERACGTDRALARHRSRPSEAQIERARHGSRASRPAPFPLRAESGSLPAPNAPPAAMDSLSQLALGASVSLAVQGRSAPARRSAAWGAVLGTLPDLDVLVDRGDPLANMVLHRAETHAFFWQTLAAPLLAWIACSLHGERARYGRWLIATWLVLVTHALLDALTVYGTRLWLPFERTAVGTGSLFIIDPLYTLPLLVGLGLALARRDPARARAANRAGLALSCLYVAWSLAAQAVVASRAREALRAAGIPHERLVVTPTAFNTVLWRVVALEHARWHEGFASLLDGDRPVRFDAFPRGGDLLDEIPGASARALADFAGGFVRARESDGVVRIADLRMGQEPGFVFEFAVARRVAGQLVPIEPEQVGGRVDVGTTLRWIARRATGADVPPPR